MHLVDQQFRLAVAALSAVKSLGGIAEGRVGLAAGDHLPDLIAAPVEYDGGE
jgi:hypothetical protein